MTSCGTSLPPAVSSPCRINVHTMGTTRTEDRALARGGPVTAPAFRLAVVDPLPLFRLGVLELFAREAIFAQTPTDIVAWLEGVQCEIVILTLADPSGWKSL